MCVYVCVVCVYYTMLVCMCSLLRTTDPGVNREGKKSIDGRTLVSNTMTAHGTCIHGLQCSQFSYNTYDV